MGLLRKFTEYCRIVALLPVIPLGLWIFAKAPNILNCIGSWKLLELPGFETLMLNQQMAPHYLTIWEWWGISNGLVSEIKREGWKIKWRNWVPVYLSLVTLVWLILFQINYTYFFYLDFLCAFCFRCWYRKILQQITSKGVWKSVWSMLLYSVLCIWYGVSNWLQNNEMKFGWHRNIV